MSNRDFSDSIKLAVITDNLRNNNGDILCAACGKKMTTIQECHFDHIVPFAKGGKSSLDNCQILCSNCNLKKNDKELQDFLLEEKAKRFLAGETALLIEKTSLPPDQYEKQRGLTKDEFDASIYSFIRRKGNINKVDFGREYNHLPSIHYVQKFYGDLTTLKKEFGVEDLSSNWNRETIRAAIGAYLEKHGDIVQTDMKKQNKLPSIPCILSKFPEYHSFSEFKKAEFNLAVREQWDTEKAIRAGKEFVSVHGKITESTLCSKYHLPTSKVIYRLFGSLANYQKAVGSELSFINEYVSRETINRAVDQHFGESERIIESMSSFLKEFQYSSSVIHKRFGSFSIFCEENHIVVVNAKKAKYTKQEVDDAIAIWIKNGNNIPLEKNLTASGLPSSSVIQRFYENWREPFVIYQKLFAKIPT